ncbi:MAG: hydrogen gas-evolving membrane-bound hydrogenase subunit E [Candidatus Omnitrophota bacterium]
MIELHIILILMIIGAIVAMEIEDLLSSIIALGAVGIGLSLEFLLLRAPDLAITQLVVEILSLVILIKATVGMDLPSGKIKLNPGYLLFAGLFVAGFIWFSQRALLQLPVFGKPIMKMGSQYIAEAAKKTGAANIVSAVILDFRGYDTLGEATILFTSVIGVLAVLRKTGKKK